MKKNIPAFENVANLHTVPATGAMVYALPMKIGAGTGAPLRIIATWDDEKKKSSAAGRIEVSVATVMAMIIAVFLLN